MNFDEICRRASGRRAYNRRRRLQRERRISAILALQARAPNLTGRQLARLLEVHESTVSRDLKAVTRLRRQWRRMMACGPLGFEDMPLLPQNLSWVRAGRGWLFKFKWKDGVRVL